MRIRNLRLSNIGIFKDLNLSFDKNQKKYNHILLIGNNGSGKSTILESIALGLSWFITRVKTDKGSGNHIKELQINNDANNGSIHLSIENENLSYNWLISKSRRGKKIETPSNLKELNALTNDYRTSYTINDQQSFPILLFYDATRGVLDFPMRIRKKHEFGQLNGYDSSLKGAVDYRTFFEWFREQEDAENEDKVRLLKNPNLFNKDDFKQLKEKINKIQDGELNAVRSALKAFLPAIDNIRVKRKPRIHLAIDKDGKTLNIEQLSQGEKLLIAMIGDIARRLSIMNPGLKNPLRGEGIVLIDEAELHLHPRWQRNLLAQLDETFPNIQFIYTTHSPLLISDFREALVYSLDFGEVTDVGSVYGNDVNLVLTNTMDTTARPQEVQDIINSFRNAISNKDLRLAEKIFLTLNNHFEETPNNLELIKSKILLQKLRLSNEKNN